MIESDAKEVNLSMKLLKSVVLLALLSLTGHAQERSMLYGTYALKGPVRTFRVEIAPSILRDGEYIEGPRQVQMEAWFNQDGNRTNLHLYNDKGILVRRIVMKFDGRKMTEALNYDGAGQMWLRIVNNYDDQGALKEALTYHEDGSLRSKKTFKRDELGQIIEISEYNAQGILLDQTNNSFDGRLLLTSNRKVYREDGSLASTNAYDAAESKSETINYQRNAAIENTVVRIGQQLEQYGHDGALQKTGTISAEHRLLDEIVLAKNGSAKKVWNTPEGLDAYGNEGVNSFV